MKRQKLCSLFQLVVSYGEKPASNFMLIAMEGQFGLSTRLYQLLYKIENDLQIYSPQVLQKSQTNKDLKSTT